MNDEEDGEVCRVDGIIMLVSSILTCHSERSRIGEPIHCDPAKGVIGSVTDPTQAGSFGEPTPPSCCMWLYEPRKVYIRLHGKGNSNSLGARSVFQKYPDDKVDSDQ